jgi:hypothetical protein
MATASELKIDTSASAGKMADAMFGNGIEIVSASYTGATAASGIYTGADTTMPGVAPSDSGVILSTGKVTDITNSKGDPNLKSGMSTNHNTAGDSDLEEIAGAKTYDAAVFKADFIPQGDTLTMQVTFSSEEYLEYVNGGFNDAVGIWVNGEKAELTVGDGDITIDNINDTSNSNLYLDNPSSKDLYNTEMDGVTVTLTLKAPVKPGEVNSIKIAIADGGDGVYDSNLMIAGDSIQTALVADDDVVDLEGAKETTLDVLANDASASGGTLTITHLNGHPVMAGDEIELGSGEVVRLNADGSLTIMSDGAGEENAFSYTVADTVGNTDTAFVKMTSTVVPCFVAGTPVDTPRGPVPVEQLRPGDAVLTRDGGTAVLRWIGIAARRAEGKTAPVRISAGLFGATQDIAVSPQHRVLVTGPRAALLFGEDEVLVRARDLVDGSRVTWEEDGTPLRYVHLMFDRHEIVRTAGMWSESYQPGARSLSAFDGEAREELFRLFPELASLGQNGWGRAARMTLRQREARVLIATPPPLPMTAANESPRPL